MSTELVATGERLLGANYSNQAIDQIDAWRNARDAGQIYVVGACSDARLILPNRAFHIRTISATGPRSPWHEAFSYDKVLGVLILGHFVCGGLKVKEVLSIEQTANEEEEARGFVREHVWHSDPIIQVIYTGSWTASRTHKPVLASVQDHRIGDVYNQGSFNNRDQTEHKTVPTYLLSSQYIKENIYQSGVPDLAEGLVSPIFRSCLQEIAGEAAALRKRYIDFSQMQAVQNPEFVCLTDCLKPLAVRFPGLFDEPNNVFQVSLGRQSLDSGDLDNKGITDAFKQINYPVSHSTEHHDNPHAAFHDTRVLYIETIRMKDSELLAKRAMRRKWVQGWLELPNREIIIAQVNSGMIRSIDRIV